MDKKCKACLISRLELVLSYSKRLLRLTSVQTGAAAGTTGTWAKSSVAPSDRGLTVMAQHHVDAFQLALRMTGGHRSLLPLAFGCRGWVRRFVHVRVAAFVRGSTHSCGTTASLLHMVTASRRGCKMIRVQQRVRDVVDRTVATR